MTTIHLSGTWQGAPADERLRRDFASPALDDAGWEPVTVPGHWRSVPAFADLDGPILYRRRFEAAGPAAGRRRWLVLDGLFYQGDVWLDGAYLGDTEGYFAPHTFEVTDALAGAGEHLLAVEVTCNRERDPRRKRNITGVFQHWNCLDPDWNPGGIWRPVRIEETGPVRIVTARVLCTEASEEQAVVAVQATLDTDAQRTVSVRTTVAGVDHEAEHTLATGHNTVEWRVAIPTPRLWWPRSLAPGEQPLHDVTVEVRTDDGTRSDTATRRTGLRHIAWRRWVMEVNGERLFLKGSNQGPTRMALAEATRDELAGDVGLAVDAGLDLLRVHGHISRPELYDAADEAGLLLWQDMPLQWGYARGIRRQAVRQARAAVDLLGHHPSIALWCGHNEPLAIDIEPGEAAGTGTRLAVQWAMGQALPGWNKTVLDRSVRRAIEHADGTRPVVAHSGVVGQGRSDSHLYFGWYHGDERDLPAFTARLPRLVRFVSEFGAQAVPTTADFCGPEAWPDLDWERLGRTHALQKEIFDRRVPPARFAAFEEWRDATQAYQATVVKHHVEHLRRLKYRPAGGFCQFSLADGHPAVTWSVLDHRRVAKAGYQALTEACRPVIVVADRLPARVAPGEALALDIHAVSDLRRTLEDGVVTALLAWGIASGQEATSHCWRWTGDIPADDCVRVGTLQAVVPDVPGPLTLDLTLEAGDVRATNRYETVITRPARESAPTHGSNYLRP